MNYIFLQNTLQKNDLNAIKVIKNIIKKALKKSKSQSKVKNIINLVCITQEL